MKHIIKKGIQSVLAAAVFTGMYLLLAVAITRAGEDMQEWDRWQSGR